MDALATARADPIVPRHISSTYQHARFVIAMLVLAGAAGPAHAEDRAIDGSGNHLINPSIGATGLFAFCRYRLS